MHRQNELPIVGALNFWAYLLIVLAIGVGVGCGVRAGNVVLIPMGFEGWVVIHYDIPREPAFDHEGAKTLVKVPESGSLSTSSNRPNGYGIDEYFFVAADGKRVRVQNEAEGCNDQEPCIQQFEFVTSPTKMTMFFVGKKPDVARYPKPKVP
jgi:hypothetical protein